MHGLSACAPRWRPGRWPALAVGALLALAAPAPARAAYSFAGLDAPGGSNQAAVGINDQGQVVGSYTAADGTQHGYLAVGGRFTSTDFGAAYNVTPEGINNAGQVVGYAFNPSAGARGYSIDGFLRGADGTITRLDVPGATAGSPAASATFALGINDLAQVVGQYYDPVANAYHGFLYDAMTRRYSTIDFPGLGVGGNSANAINDRGQVVGNYTDRAGVAHGYLYSGGAFTTVDDPLGVAGSTYLSGINNLGQIVGTYLDAGGTIHGFIDTNGAFATIDDPSASGYGTSVYGINDAGQLVGSYNDPSGNGHGFIASPAAAVPEPSSLVLLGLAGAPAAAVARLRRRGRASRG